MKKILFTLALFFIINLNLAALTMKEKIQQDLSKAGVKQEIIDETVKLDKKFVEEFVVENEDVRLKKFILDFWKIFFSSKFFRKDDKSWEKKIYFLYFEKICYNFDKEK